MVRSSTATVEDYLESLPAERRAVVSRVRRFVRSRLPRGYREAMNWGMIAWEVPLARYPRTYNGKPLLFAALAAQKRNYALIGRIIAGAPLTSFLAHYEKHHGGKK